ncbi:substrate-binding domain-containing protein [Ralstonia wenshanensis]|uniref:substrate-binding domain-containing protein n=1 Tax=Ralstonia wenshanensis TaxID=2842456 RepID=UPI0039C601C8
MPFQSTMRRLAVRSLCAIPLIAATSGAWAADIHVLATGALHAAFEKVIPAYEQQSGNHLIIAWGPSYGSSPDALPMRIKNGEPMDVCFMIGAALTDQVKQGRFIPESRVDLVASGVGVAVRKGLPKPNIQTVDDLRQTLLAAKSVAFSEGASGTYITGTLFARLGIAEQMKAKSVLIRGKELVGSALERGEADLGLQQISELRAFDGIQYVGPLPAEVQKTSVIAVAVAKDAKERQAAEGLITYLRSPEVAAKLVQTGLDPISAK